MATLQDLRQKYPQYSDMSDEQLARGFHDKYYADMPFDQFAQKIGYQQVPTAPTDKYAGMSFGDKVKNDLVSMWTQTKRAGLLAAKGVNDAIVQTELLPANAVTQGINLATGRSDPTLGQMYQAKSDRSVAPASNLAENLVQAGAGFVAGAKIPMPGNSAPSATGALASTVSGARGAGYVMLPSNVKPTMPRRVLEAILGKKELLADATQRNMPKASENIAIELGLKKGTEINQNTIDAVIAREGEAYDAIASQSPAYAEAVQAVKELRNTAKKYFRQSAANYSVEAEQKATEAWTKAQQMDDLINQSLKAQGKPELYSRYQEARQMIAKAYDTMRALVKSRGELDSSSFARDFGKSKPQSGAIRDLGQTVEAFPGEFSTPQGSPWKGFDQFLVGSGVGVQGLFHQPDYALGLVGGAAARALGRRVVLSKAYQDGLMLSPEQKQAAISEAFLRAGVASKGFP